MALLNPITRLLDKIQLFISVRLLDRQTSERHVALYRRTGGRMGGKVRELPVLLLTTTGRKSGQPRTVPLSYLPYGASYVVTASNFGGEQHPLWFLNLQSDPRARVQVGQVTREVVARVASREERARLWTALTRKARNYAEYEKMTERDIPMVILRPVSGTGGIDLAAHPPAD